MRRIHNIYRRRYFNLTPVIEVSEEEKKKNLAKFEKKNERLAEMMKELEERNPWLKSTIQSIRGRAERRGNLTQKQKTWITSLYMDNCIRSDADIREQIEVRKLCFKLLNTHLGEVRSFISSVITSTDGRPFTPAQIRGIRNVAARKEKELAQVPDMTENNFDGWYIKRSENVDYPTE